MRFFQFLWTMMRAWERKHPANRAKLSTDSVTFELHSRTWETSFDVDSVSFEPHPDANPASRLAGLKRFQVKKSIILVLISQAAVEP